MKLTILATSDMHGYVLPTNYADTTDQPYGVAKVATKMKELTAAATGPVIKIENGDFIQGSPLSYYVAKQGEQNPALLTKVVNQIGYDVGLLGNHEFNYGPEYLQKAINSYEHPILAANVLGENGRPYFGQPYVIIEKAGVKVAILGVVTQYIPHWEQPSHIKGLHFQSLVETAKQYVPKLRELADVVIVAYHGGFERDLETGEATELITGENEGYELLHSVSGIDALITGHQHREIAGVVNGVPVIQPGSFGRFVGEIVLDLKKTATGVTVTGASASIHPVADCQPDTGILASVAELNQNLETWLDQPVGRVEGDMRIQDSMKARLKEHPYVEFINKVQMEASGAPISGTALFNNEGKGFDETITMRNIITNYIYPNTLAVSQITGADLRQALEQTANYLALEDGKIVFNPRFIKPKPQYYNYDMYEGVDYTIDLRQPVGSRVIELRFNGQPVQATDTLEVVINQYRAVGGGNYAMFTPEKIQREVQIDMTELIADYLRRHPVIQATVNENFQILPQED
ncbi:bifunctional metallophosphatase/5'-nucleotidase [Enterococcus asini]|uniref:bifunctional metallophosphatase/5'-nucleotidase n=1 Tax=Enterococcus asini TaxID=57732 RepID=UPI0022E78A15|nr:bifunctional metallophosphatase/5'-nucleotidase [Enterococcus asini]